MKLDILAWPALVVTVAAWGAAGLLYFNSYSPPIAYLGGDTVEPRVVKRGGEITITRNMRFLREEEVRLTRALIRGDCRKNCEIVELPSTQMAIAASENISRSRDITIPASVEPGKYRLVFSMHWSGMFGRTVVAALPELEIEVTQ